MLELREATITFSAGKVVIDLPEGHRANIIDNRFSFLDRNGPRLVVNIGGKHAVSFDPAKYGAAIPLVLG